MEWWVKHQGKVSEQPLSADELTEHPGFGPDLLVSESKDGGWLKLKNSLVLQPLLEAEDQADPSAVNSDEPPEKNDGGGTENESILKQNLIIAFANVAPVLGILFGGWTVFGAMAYFWLENVLYGLAHALKIFAWQGSRQRIRNDARSLRYEMKGYDFKIEGMYECLKLFEKYPNKNLFAVLFFLSYSLVCLVQGAFLVNLFNLQSSEIISEKNSPPRFESFLELMEFHLNAFVELLNVLTGPELLAGTITLTLCYLLTTSSSVISGSLINRSVPDLIMEPFKYVLLMHLTIILTGVFVMYFKLPVVLLIGLIVGKTFLDWSFHPSA